MIIDCIADLHGHYPKLEGGDLLIVAGDLTARHTEKEWHEFANWLDKQNYKKIIFIAGNHDTMIEKWDKEQDAEGYQGPASDSNDRIEYLCDSGTTFRDWPILKAGMEDGATLEVKDYKIWGSPWTKTFEGMNPKCKAFTCDTEEELAEKWAQIPDDIDILVTHSPPWGILDLIEKIDLNENNDHKFKGSLSLKYHVMNRIKPLVHIYGHIHECGGYQINTVLTKFINCSHVNERYNPVNKPIRVIL